MLDDAGRTPARILANLQVLQLAEEAEIRLLGDVTTAQQLSQADLPGPELVESLALLAELHLKWSILRLQSFQFRLVGVQTIEELVVPHVGDVQWYALLQRLGGKLRPQAVDLRLHGVDLGTAWLIRLEQGSAHDPSLGKLGLQRVHARALLADGDETLAGLLCELRPNLAHVRLNANDVAAGLAALRLQIDQLLGAVLLLGRQLGHAVLPAEVQQGVLGALETTQCLPRLRLNELACLGDLLEREDPRALQVMVEHRVGDACRHRTIRALNRHRDDVRVPDAGHANLRLALVARRVRSAED